MTLQRILNSIPDYKEVIELGLKYWKDFGPFGVERVKIIDAAFVQILENLIFTANKKLLYVADKDIPTNKDQFQRYQSMK